jgi:arylsulfatase A-like enzyme
MPARRELHTGRYNFYHRSWGPIEPYDDSMPYILSQNGIHSHLTTDHYHYLEDGGATYHTHYTTWECNRGREGDPWKGHIKDPEIPKLHPLHRIDTGYKQDFHNRAYLPDPEDQPQYKTFSQGIEFMETNVDAENYFLQVEPFDPHEPFYSPEKYKKLYEDTYTGDFVDWPNYKKCDEADDVVDHVRKEYAALVSMCDENLGRLLDKMDELDMWKDTMLIVSTDHGYSLGENGWWAKIFGGWYNATAHIPFYVWDPRCGRKNERSDRLVQWIDIAPTVLEAYNLPIPKDMKGKSLKNVVAKDEAIHDYVSFGVFGGQANITDGKYVYMRGPACPENTPLHEYTLMPTHLRSLFSVEEMNQAEFVDGFDFTKGCKMLKIPGVVQNMCTAEVWSQWKTELYDIVEDYGQEHPLQDEELEKRMLSALEEIMIDNDVPVEQYTRLGMKIPTQAKHRK